MAPREAIARPVDDTTFSSSISMPGSLATSEPVAMTIAFVPSCVVPPSASVTSTSPGFTMRPCAVVGFDLVLLQQEGDTVDACFSRPLCP